MIKLSHDLAKIAEVLYSTGLTSEAKDVFFTAVKVAHNSNPLNNVLVEEGYDSCDLREMPRENLNDSPEGIEIWIHLTPDGLVYQRLEGDDAKEFNNFEDLVSHEVEHSDCGCGHSDNEPLSEMVEKYASRDEDDCEHENTYEDWGTAGRSFAPLIICEDCGKVLRVKDWEDYESEERDRESYASKKKNVKLNKPFRTPGGPKKFSVYVKNEKGNVVKVNFGDPNMEIKRDDPKRRKNFRARHNCDNPGPKTKAKFWSCKMWSKPSVSKLLKGK